MISIIAATTLIDTVLNSVGIISTPIMLFTDSETSITTSKNGKLNTLHFVISNDVDVALQLRESILQCKQHISLEHVKGHQDKTKKFHELPLPAQLNILMDKLSKKMVADTKHECNNIIPFPAQKIYLSMQTPIAHDVVNVLITNEMKHEIKGYYNKHHKVPESSFSQIDWEAQRLAMNAPSEISYRKTFHNLRNTMTINKKWKRIESDLCPLCNKSPETIAHLMSCTHPDITMARNSAIRRLFQTIHNLNTNTHIASFWRVAFQNLIDKQPVPKPSLTMDPITWNVTQAYHQQKAIGWDVFSKGILASKWSKIQQKQYDDDPKDGENIFRWKRIVVRSFMDVYKELWQLRCGYINAEVILTEREMLSHRTLQMFLNNRDKKDMLSIIDRHLLNKQESYFRTSSRATLELWESRTKEALQLIKVREGDQTTLTFTAISGSNNRSVSEELISYESQNNVYNNRDTSRDLEYRLRSLDEYIQQAQRMKRKRVLTNSDPVWNKRLRTTRKYMATKKRIITRRYSKCKRRRTSDEDRLRNMSDISFITPQFIDLNTINSCERS